MVYLILGQGFEEAEAVIPCDLLRRAGIEVRLVGIGGTDITGGHGITLHADCAAEQTDFSDAELLVLPGGMGGVASILGSKTVLDAVSAQYRRGKPVAAICAAPTILARLGITDEKRATCYPGMEAEMGAAVCTGESAVRDGGVITGRAAGTAFDFALTLIEALRGTEAARRVADAIVYR